ncbi:sodium:solute symporter [Allofrancisella guangzhouensis]|uniref:sodium:solute symporter family protein n=1 Tax=Allofrancisella guangzhouensis TaxID=594679 RepID=UPI00069218E0|nr:sodium:solute symporter [Allofrancisella guangzhouensis]MBK2027930.1 sodium:solute symporter [Allofrancisella guangzhouensis]MBK2043707.1 sodium:solute symporter [Allofrancisella guangzhouensis]MBK2046236.1 sodium:solute symporter [Allofrancisella guangzhouensis]
MTYNKSETTDYFTAGKTVGFFALTATLVMTELNTSTLIGFSSLGYLYGFSAASLGLVFLLGLFFYAITVAKKWKNFDAISVTEFFQYRYNKSFGIFAAFCLWVAMLGFGANFIHSITVCLEIIFPTYPKALVTFVACNIMFVATISSGLRSIIQIDKISFVLCIILFVFLGIHFYSSHQPSTITNNLQHKLPLSFALSLAILTCFTYILSPWYGQKVFSAKTPKIAFYSMLTTAILVSLFYLIAILTTANFTQQLNLNNSDLALAHIIATELPLSIEIGFYVILFLIATTTIAALWNTMASVIFVHSSYNKATNSNRLIVLGIAILSYFIAVFSINQILDKMLLFNIPIAALSFSLLYGFYGKKRNLIGAILSTTVGTVVATILYLFLDQESFVFYWAFLCVPLIFIVGFLCSFIKPHQSYFKGNKSKLLRNIT